MLLDTNESRVCYSLREQPHSSARGNLQPSLPFLLVLFIFPPSFSALLLCLIYSHLSDSLSYSQNLFLIQNPFPLTFPLSVSLSFHPVCLYQPVPLLNNSVTFFLILSFNPLPSSFHCNYSFVPLVFLPNYELH